MRLRAHAGALRQGEEPMPSRHAALWCAGIEGCYYNIMGLPVHRTAQLLREAYPDPDSPRKRESVWEKSATFLHAFSGEYTLYVYQRHRH